MANVGEGLIHGLQSAIGSYMDTTRAREDREERRRLADLEYRSKGLLPEYDESGKIQGLIEDPAFRERQLQSQINEAAAQGKILGRGEDGGLIFKGFSPEYIEAQRKMNQIKSEADPTANMLKILQTQKLAGDIKEQESKIAEKVEKKEAGEKMAKQQAGLVAQELGRALNLSESSPMSSGSFLGQTAVLPGTPAWQLEKALETAKANIGFDKLQAMRAASPTGGALGSVSDREIGMLQATAGKLDTRLPTPVLQDNIKRLINQYNDVIHGPDGGPERYQLSFDEMGRPVERGLVNKPRRSGLLPSQTEAAPQKPKIFKTNEIEWAD